MKVVVVGAGVVGLVAALRLGQAGHEVVVLERWPGLGGQAATIDVGDGHLLERYYHHWFTSDRHALDLCAELGVPVEEFPSSTAFFVDGQTRAFTSPLDLLRFTPLSLRDRLRMGLAVVRLQRSKAPVSAYEGETARDWIRREMGEAPYDKIWGPLLRGKFGSRADDISMAWLWGKLVTRRKLEGKQAAKEQLAYPVGSFEAMLAGLRRKVEAAGGRVVLDRPVRRVDRDDSGFVLELGAPGSYRRGTDPATFDGDGTERADVVLATVPSDVFTSVAGHLVPTSYVDQLASIDYHVAVCLLLELDRQFGRYYWTNIADPALPFVGLIEHTNLVPSQWYDGRRFLYVANYVEPGDPILDLDAQQLLEHYLPGLRAVQPGFDPSWVKAVWRHVEHAGQPIVDLGYAGRIAPFETGVPGLLLANTTQIYPEDRGTNYAVREGEQAVAALLAHVEAQR